jgi:hypothetical protein
VQEVVAIVVPVQIQAQEPQAQALQIRLRILQSHTAPAVLVEPLAVLQGLPVQMV